MKNVKLVWLICLVIVITFSLSGCVYSKFGNPSITNQSEVEQVKVGQTKEQVQQILGKPTGAYSAEVDHLFRLIPSS